MCSMHAFVAVCTPFESLGLVVLPRSSAWGKHATHPFFGTTLRSQHTNTVLVAGTGGLHFQACISQLGRSSQAGCTVGQPQQALLAVNFVLHFQCGVRTTVYTLQHFPLLQLVARSSPRQLVTVKAQLSAHGDAGVLVSPWRHALIAAAAPCPGARLAPAHRPAPACMLRAGRTQLSKLRT